MKLLRSYSPSAVPLLFLAPAMEVLFILIFFLLLSRSFLLQPGVAVDLPDSPFILSPQRNPQIVSITAPPVSAIFFDNEKMDLATLRERLKNNAGGRTQTIIIKADKHALYENIVAVTDIALALGFPVVLATAEDSDQ